jgi:hypothetical protein
MAREIEFIGFTDTDAALAHRAQEGGWIFSSYSGEAIWFSTKFTQSKILKHRAIAGLSGRIL